MNDSSQCDTAALHMCRYCPALCGALAILECFLQDIPRLEIPLHTLIELTPKPDGTMAEERIPLDVKGHSAEELPSHMQKHLDLRGGPYATPMTPFSPYEGGGTSSPFARVDSMGTGLDNLSTVSCWAWLVTVMSQ